MESYYSIETPTDPADKEGTSGIWFFKRDSVINEIKDTTGTVVGYDTVVTMASGMSLPELKNDLSGWTYESFVIWGNDTISLGKFKNPAKADDENPYSGSETPFNYPGEDLLQNAPAGLTFPADLSGKKIIVTITPPSADGTHTAYTSTIFETVVDSNPDAQKNILLDFKEDGLQTGTIRITTQIYEQE